MLQERILYVKTVAGHQVVHGFLAGLLISYSPTPVHSSYTKSPPPTPSINFLIFLLILALVAIILSSRVL